MVVPPNTSNWATEMVPPQINSLGCLLVRGDIIDIIHIRNMISTYIYIYIGIFQIYRYMEVSRNGGIQNGWLISWKILLKLEDLGVPLFQETSNLGT